MHCMAPKRNKITSVATIILAGVLAGWFAPNYAGADQPGVAAQGDQSNAPVAAAGRASAAPTGGVASATAPTPTPEPIACDVPPYTDHGIMMAPLRPICQFLGLTLGYADDVVTLQSKQSPDRIVIFRVGGQSAQIQNGAEHKSDRFPCPSEERLGNMFVPLKFIAICFGADSAGATIIDGDRRGALTFQSVPPPPDKEAAIVSVFNYTHRAMSLHLDGPQKVILELGSGESVLLKIRPGRYNYWAESMGMQVHSGSRSFSIDHKATWIWGG